LAPSDPIFRYETQALNQTVATQKVVYLRPGISMRTTALRRLTTYLAYVKGRAVVFVGLMALTLDGLVLGHSPPGADRGETSAWWPLVQNVAHGFGYVQCLPDYFPFCGAANQATAMHEPVPVLLFAGVAVLGHDSLQAVAALQVVVHLVILFGVVLVARRLAGHRTALLAGVVWALYIPALRLVPSASGDLLGALGVTWGVLAFMAARRAERTWLWLAAGGCLGLGALSRSAVLVIAPALALGNLAWPFWPTLSMRGRVQRSLLVLAAWGLVQLPWVVRNELTFGRPVLGSTLAGYNIFRHNSALGTSDFVRYIGPAEAQGAVQFLLAHRPELQGTENEADLEAVYRHEGLALIAAQPLKYITLVAGRFFMLWFNWTVPEAYGQTLASDPGYLAELQQVLLVAGGALGALTIPWRRCWPATSTIIVVGLTYMAVDGQLRYLVSVAPLLMVLSAIACTQVGERLGGKLRVTALGERLERRPVDLLVQQ
jgi:hypothetical protein